MKRNIIETVLGAVVLAVAGVFLAYSTTVADVGDVEGYKVIARFNEIGGLKVGDDVRVGGVKIGTIDAINLDQKTYQAELSLTIEDGVELPSDTAARISSESLLGGAFLALDPGGDDTMLKSGGRIAYTQDAQNLEQLLGKFIFSMADSKNKDKDDAGAAPKANDVPVPAPQTLPQM